MASGTAPPQKRRLRHEQAALGSGRSETSGGGGEKAETRGPASRPQPTPPSAPETQFGDAGPGQPRGPRGTGFGGPDRAEKTPTGWGLAGTQGSEIREQPRSARRGLPAEAGRGPETAEDQAQTKKSGSGASRRDRTSGSPAAEGRPLLAPAPGPPPEWPQSPRDAELRAPGGAKVGGGGERSRRAPRPGAVIERSAARPSPGSAPPTQPFIHSSILSPSTHLLSIHVSGLSSVRPIIAPGITLMRQSWLSPLSPARQSVRAILLGRHLAFPQAPLCLAGGRSAPHDLSHSGFAFQ